MAIVDSSNENLLQIVSCFGVNQETIRNAKEIHIHIVANEAVFIDIIRYANLQDCADLETKRFNLVEVL